jgi:hypothetical protein
MGNKNDQRKLGDESMELWFNPKVALQKPRNKEIISRDA